jgi:hypothetical protein
MVMVEKGQHEKKKIGRTHTRVGIAHDCHSKVPVLQSAHWLGTSKAVKEAIVVAIEGDTNGQGGHRQRVDSLPLN